MNVRTTVGRAAIATIHLWFRYCALLGALWWIAVGAVMLTCGPQRAKAHLPDPRAQVLDQIIADLAVIKACLQREQTPAHVPPWRGGAEDGHAGVPAATSAPWANVAKIAANPEGPTP